MYHQGNILDKIIFGPTTTNSTYVNYATWEKPRGIQMINFIIIGAGGAGGNGAVGAAGSMAGGGGGGSGGLTHLLIPAAFVPDILFLAIKF